MKDRVRELEPDYMAMKKDLKVEKKIYEVNLEDEDAVNQIMREIGLSEQEVSRNERKLKSMKVIVTLYKL